MALNTLPLVGLGTCPVVRTPQWGPRFTVSALPTVPPLQRQEAGLLLVRGQVRAAPPGLQWEGQSRRALLQHGEQVNCPPRKAPRRHPALGFPSWNGGGSVGEGLPRGWPPGAALAEDKHNPGPPPKKAWGSPTQLNQCSERGCGHVVSRYLALLQRA